MLLLDFEIAARVGRLKAAVRKRPGQAEMIEMCRRAACGEQLSFAQLFTARRYASRTLLDAGPTSPQAQDLARSYPPGQLDVWLPTTGIVLICLVVGIANALNQK